MTIILRDYQEDIIERTRVALRTHNSVMIVLPTGGGKTALSGRMMATTASKGLKGLFLCHRQELLDQTADTFKEFEIPHGIIAAGYAPNPLQPIQIASIDTVKSRIRRGIPLPQPAICVWDEAHHLPAAGWAQVKTHFKTARHVGLTATPERLDRKGLGDFFTAMIEGPDVATLMARGFLAKYRAFAPSHPDLSGVHSKMGDYIKAESEGVMNQPSITGNAIHEYLKHARDKRGLAFCISINHSQNVAAQFRTAGIVAWHLDGDTEKGERRQAMQAFRRGEIKVLCSVDLFAEGLNVPDAEVCVGLRPTQSRALYRQQIGRVLRPGKTALILDHAGNIARFGLPDDPITWSLDGDKRTKKERDQEAALRVTQCPRCYHCHKPAPSCPNCGHVYGGDGRIVKQRDGVLEEIDPAAVRAQRKQEERKARTLDELVKLGRSRRYASPEKWAAAYYTARLAAKKKYAGE